MGVITIPAVDGLLQEHRRACHHLTELWASANRLGALGVTDLWASAVRSDIDRLQRSLNLALNQTQAAARAAEPHGSD